MYNGVLPCHEVLRLYKVDPLPLRHIPKTKVLGMCLKGSRPDNVTLGFLLIFHKNPAIRLLTRGCMGLFLLFLFLEPDGVNVPGAR